MIDITGFEEITPYKGGWCGNDIAATALRPMRVVVVPGLIVGTKLIGLTPGMMAPEPDVTARPPAACGGGAGFSRRPGGR
jgi:hypothetical protein